MTTTVNIQTAENPVEITVITYDQEGSSHPKSDVLSGYDARTVYISGSQSVTIREMQKPDAVDDDPEN
jgi:hypothetical protein